MRVGGVVHPIPLPARPGLGIGPSSFLSLCHQPLGSTVGDLISSDKWATAQVFGFTSRRRFMRKGGEKVFTKSGGILTSPVGT